ncbi:MAG: dTMP kinase [Micrococcus sp.]|nr:dTMP kinase [Micrococcus sp.]
MNNAARTPGLFLAFEGPDGSGKSTQAAALAAALTARGVPVHLTREPGGTPLGERLRSLVLTADDGPVDERTEALLFAAARATHATQLIRPCLAAGTTVVTDRYIDSSVAYQGHGRGLGAAWIAELNAWATDGLVPDLTIVLDIDAAQAAARRTAREDASGAGPDRMEQSLAHAHETLRGAFLEAAQAAPERYLVLDATTESEQLAEQILDAVLALAAERTAS